MEECTEQDTIFCNHEILYVQFSYFFNLRHVEISKYLEYIYFICSSMDYF